jgi:uncharacterized protein
MTLKDQIHEDMKAAMRAKQADRLSAIRMLLAAIKQKEVDERITVDDPQTVAIVDKLIKQRKDSVTAFEAAARTDLVAKERAEIEVLSAYLPRQMSEAEVNAAIDSAIQTSGAAGAQEMGKVMAILKPKLAGRADMSKVSTLVKTKLAP